MFLLGIVATVVSIASEGYCGMKLWNWFVPLWIPSAPELTLGIACGLGLMAHRFLYSTEVNEIKKLIDGGEETRWDIFRALVICNIATPFTSLLMGWIILQVI